MVLWKFFIYFISNETNSCKEKVQTLPSIQVCDLAADGWWKEVTYGMGLSACISGGSAHIHLGWGREWSRAAWCSFAPACWGCRAPPGLLRDKVTPIQAGKWWALDHRGSLILDPKSEINSLEAFMASPVAWILAASLGEEEDGLNPFQLALGWGSSAMAGQSTLTVSTGLWLLLWEVCASRAVCICSCVKPLLKRPFQTSWGDTLGRRKNVLRCDC